MTGLTIEAVCARWRSRDRPLFKGKLIDDTGCCCAQGDVLRLAGASDADLRAMWQNDADRKVAKILGISLAHSVLLRIVNDRADGCPQDVLEHPERVLGDQAQVVLAFWRHLDRMTAGSWAVVQDAAETIPWERARTATWDAAWAAARTASGTVALAATLAATLAAIFAATSDVGLADALAASTSPHAAAAAAWTAALAIAEDADVDADVDIVCAAPSAASWATIEIQGVAHLQRFFFLPLFGFATPADIPQAGIEGSR